MYRMPWVEGLHMRGAVFAPIVGGHEANHGASQIRDEIHTVPLSQVYEQLSSRAKGLTQPEAAERLRSVGPNTIHRIKGKPLLLRFIADFTHLMALLLWVGGAIAFVAGMPQLGYAVWLVNIINGLFSFWQEFKAEKATEALQTLLPVYAHVLREGEEVQIRAAELVPGDVMLLAEGDHISADGRLVQEAELRVDQSTLSGESHPVSKSCEAVNEANLAHTELPNLVFAGTNVVAGTGKAVVFATGMQTEFGNIAHLTQSLGEELSPLQKEIIVITKMVTMVAVGVGVLFFLVALLMGAMNVAEGFIFALGMIVAFVPEGLLPTVTLALAMGVQRMAKRNALVKRLSAVETLGSTTVICTDKTGTLTQNEMTVRKIWVARRQILVTGVGFAPEGELQEENQPISVASDLRLARLLTAACLCNNTRLVPPNDANPRWTILGDPTEAALLVAGMKAGLDSAILAQAQPRLREAPFDSRRKRMSTLHQANDMRVVYVKGAPKELLALSHSIAVDKGEVPLTESLRAEVMAANDEYACNGLRVLAIACRAWCAHGASFSAEEGERDLIFLGLMAMMDPPRPEISAAVQRCHEAGIRTIMITGDYGLTAASIARRIGIVRSSVPRIVTGAELDTLSETNLQQILKDEVIFARVSPEHKLRVVTALQASGHIVAVTGDGVNDAPALKKADIGIAMGLTGTDVAKEAAAMILTDDNFATIVNAIEEGRTVYANIKKFTTYIFTSNAPEAVPFILFALSGGRIPLALTIMQILAVDLGTDLVPALALGAERPEPGLMARLPRRRDEHVITSQLLRRAYLWLGPAQGVLAMAAFYLHYWLNGFWGQWTDLSTSGALYLGATAMTLAAIVATQVGNLLAQRTERSSILKIGLFGNRLVWLGIVTELILIVLIVYAPPLQYIFGTAEFPLYSWLFLVAMMPALLLIDEARKWLLRRHTAD
jgi:magnesium-transporting ATPase (P-type)